MDNKSLVDNFNDIVQNSIRNITFNLSDREVAEVISVDDTIITVSGFKKISYKEAVIINNKYLGYVALMKEDFIKVVLLDNTTNIKVGDEVKRTFKYIEVPVGDELIGRVIDGLGRPLDNLSKIKTNFKLPIERPAKAILDRSEVKIPLETGIKIIDCLIPIGRGQRELILGDRQTGKTSIAIDTILHQKNKDVICIYCSIGQRDSSIMNIINILKENDAMNYTVVVSASGTNSSGMQYITPYSATSIAEYFCEKGKSVLIVYDDLSKHAKAYREISLLLEKSPGREAYPSDVFYLHSRLLERSVNLSQELGGGNITSLPIVETESENISAYIPTNIISITDGQLYLSPSNFQKGLLPAIDISKSVSRVGSKAQLKAFKQIAGKIKIEYSQFEELEMFSRFATKLDEETEKTINKGKLIRELLKQDRFNTISLEGQIALFICINNDLFKNVDFEYIHDIEKDIVNLIENNFHDIVNKIRGNKELTNEDINKFLEYAKEIVIKYTNTSN